MSNLISDEYTVCVILKYCIFCITIFVSILCVITFFYFCYQYRCEAIKVTCTGAMKPL